jgi:hypothetical protein
MLEKEEMAYCEKERNASDHGYSSSFQNKEASSEESFEFEQAN